MAAFRLDVASEDDLPAILQQTGRSFIADRHTQLKAVAKGYGLQPEDVARYHCDCIRGLFQSALQERKYEVIVARDESGCVLGSVIWARKEPDLDAATSSSGGDDSERLGKQVPQQLVEKEEASSPWLDEFLQKTPKTVPNLEKLTAAAMSHYVSRLAPNDRPCRYIVALGVDPAHQNRGVGTALVQWGLARADKEGVEYCWVSSSNDAVELFRRTGFRDVGRLSVRLDEWAGGVERPVELCMERTRIDNEENLETDTGRWGRYTWTWLVRTSDSRIDTRRGLPR